MRCPVFPVVHRSEDEDEEVGPQPYQPENTVNRMEWVLQTYINFSHLKLLYSLQIVLFTEIKAIYSFEFLSHTNIM